MTADKGEIADNTRALEFFSVMRTLKRCNEDAVASVNEELDDEVGYFTKLIYQICDEKGHFESEMCLPLDKSKEVREINFSGREAG